MLLYRVCFLVYNLRSHSVLRIRPNTRYFGELRNDKLARSKTKWRIKNTAKKEEMQNSAQNISSSELQGF